MDRRKRGKNPLSCLPPKKVCVAEQNGNTEKMKKRVRTKRKRDSVLSEIRENSSVEDRMAKRMKLSDYQNN